MEIISNGVNQISIFRINSFTWTDLPDSTVNCSCLKNCLNCSDTPALRHKTLRSKRGRLRAILWSVRAPTTGHLQRRFHRAHSSNVFRSDLRSATLVNPRLSVRAMTLFSFLPFISTLLFLFQISFSRVPFRFNF